MRISRTLVLLLLILLLAAVAATRRPSWTERDGFVAAMLVDPANVSLDGACVVAASDDPRYAMRSFDGLMGVPNGGCVVLAGAGDGLMDADMSQCSRSSVFDDPRVVESIGVRNVQGSDACVVQFKTGRSSSEYAAYAATLRDTAIRKTAVFLAQVAVLNGLNRDIADETDQWNRCKADLITETQLYHDMYGSFLAKRTEADGYARTANGLRGDLQTCQGQAAAAQQQAAQAQQATQQAAQAAQRVQAAGCANPTGGYNVTYFNSSPGNRLAAGSVSVDATTCNGSVQNGDGSTRAMSYAGNNSWNVPEWGINGRFDGRSIAWSNNSTWSN